MNNIYYNKYYLSFWHAYKYHFLSSIWHVYECHSLFSITMNVLSTYCPTGKALSGDGRCGLPSSSSSSRVGRSGRVSSTMKGVGGGCGSGILVLLSFPSISSNTYHLSWLNSSTFGGKLEKQITFTLCFYDFTALWYLGDQMDPFLNPPANHSWWRLSILSYSQTRQFFGTYKQTQIIWIHIRNPNGLEHVPHVITQECFAVVSNRVDHPYDLSGRITIINNVKHFFLPWSECDIIVELLQLHFMTVFQKHFI